MEKVEICGADKFADRFDSADPAALKTDRNNKRNDGKVLMDFPRLGLGE